MTSAVSGLGRAAAVAALLAVYYVMALAAASQKSMTFDEMAHLTAGYTYWAFDDYRLHPENGNWPQRLGALPAILGGASFPRLDQPAWAASNVYVIGDQFLYFSGNDAGTLLRRGRAAMALVGVALGALVFAWTRRLVSPLGAWVSLVLYAFSPTFLAHGPLVTSDMAAALFFTAAAGSLWIAIHTVTPATVLGTAALVAGAALSKLSAPILAPVALIMLLVRLVGGPPLQLAIGKRRAEYGRRAMQLTVLAVAGAVVLLAAWAIVWASFGFRYTAFAAATTGQETFLGQVQAQPGAVGALLSAARRFHLLPEAYVYGLGLTLQFASERAAFLNGEYGTHGWWWFFPYAFAVKTTLPGIALGLLGTVGLAAGWRSRRAGASSAGVPPAPAYAWTPLLALVAVYSAAALTSSLNIGHRHLLPIYPALCIAAGGAATWLAPWLARGRRSSPERKRGRRTARTEPRGERPPTRRAAIAGAAVVLLLAWHVVESLAVAPSYLAYFNQLAGGPSQGYKHLADSSLDWGQDLPALAEWLQRERLQQPGAPGVYLSYFGTARPEYYGIEATLLAGFIDRRPPQPPVPLGGGLYCISATMLDVVGHGFYTPEHEDNYRAAMQNAAVFQRASGDEQALAALVARTGEPYWQQLFVQLDQLRTGRLLAYLRQREPDAIVAHTILVYRLSDADVAAALGGPVPRPPA